MSRLGRHTLRGLMSFIAVGGFASAAHAAADHRIDVGNDKTLTPAIRTIAVGDTVTWHWVGPDFDHIMQSVPGETPAWVSHSDADEPTGPTQFTRAYPQEGAFRYQCRIHPDKMFGTITVNDSGRPTASFAYSPGDPTVGQRVDFDGMGSTDSDGIVMGWAWDLDGDGSFETIGATPSWTYQSAESVTVRLRVTDNASKTHTTTKTVVVSAPPPPPAPPTESGPPPPPPSESNSGGTPGPPLLVAAAPPSLTVTAAARQRGVDGRGIRLEFACDGACAATATGSIALPGGGRIVLAKATRTLTSKGKQKFVLPIPKSARTKLRSAWKRGKTPVATIVVTTREGAPVRTVITLTR